MTCLKCSAPSEIDQYCLRCFEQLNVQAWHQLTEGLFSVNCLDGEVVSQNLKQAIATANLYNSHPELIGGKNE